MHLWTLESTTLIHCYSRLPNDSTRAGKDPDIWLFSDASTESPPQLNESPTRASRRLGEVAYHPSLSPEAIEEDNFAFLRGLTMSEMQDVLIQDFQSPQQAASYELSIVSSSSLENNCALELFSVFMLSFTKDVLPIKGSVYESERADEPLWRIDIIDELADAVVCAGLVDDMAEALTVIVPAFAARGLLPIGPCEDEPSF